MTHRPLESTSLPFTFSLSIVIYRNNKSVCWWLYHSRSSFICQHYFIFFFKLIFNVCFFFIFSFNIINYIFFSDNSNCFIISFYFIQEHAALILCKAPLQSTFLCKALSVPLAHIIIWQNDRGNILWIKIPEEPSSSREIRCGSIPHS